MDEFFDILNENGEYTGKVCTRQECHKKGLWHKAIVVWIISNDNKKVLLQKRSSNKKLWPNMWDITAGGHVLSGENGCQAAIRETKEEIGIDIDKRSLEFIGFTTSETIKEDMIDRHFNEYYVLHLDVDLNSIIIQEDEVQDIKWFDIDEIIKRVDNNYEELTTKKGCWKYLLRYIEMENNARNNIKTFNLNLNDRAFNSIIKGTKRVEIRANTKNHNYEDLKKNEYIKFTNSTGSSIVCQVLEVNHYDTVEELFVLEGTRYTTSSTNDYNEAISRINNLNGYKEEIAKSGVYAIHIKYLYSI